MNCLNQSIGQPLMYPLRKPNNALCCCTAFWIQKIHLPAGVGKHRGNGPQEMNVEHFAFVTQLGTEMEPSGGRAEAQLLTLQLGWAKLELCIPCPQHGHVSLGRLLTQMCFYNRV